MYPPSDYEISEERSERTVVHKPTGVTVRTAKLAAHPAAVSSAYQLSSSDRAERPEEIAKAGIRHLCVWLSRKYGAPSSGQADSRRVQ
jgi:hypothetical protein